MLTTEKVTKNRLKGLNCCQSVLADAAEIIGMDEKTAEDLGSLFGGGMGCAGVCGCVTAAYMALGYQFGPNAAEADPEGLKEKRAEFNRRFKERFGSINCLDLLDGLNTSIPEESAIINERGLKESVCPYAMILASEILEDML